jgi:hypothetical protein
MGEGWVFRVQAVPGESFGHYLGRFRRANALSHKIVAEHLGVRSVWVEEWERPSRRRNPTDLQLVALGKLMDVDPAQLARMLPPDCLHLQTRLCPTCYAEAPVHQAKWQRSSVSWCDRHRLPLLSACPVCNSGFRLPALWENEQCKQCGLAFAQMHTVELPH